MSNESRTAWESRNCLGPGPASVFTCPGIWLFLGAVVSLLGYYAYQCTRCRSESAGAHQHFLVGRNNLLETMDPHHDNAGTRGVLPTPGPQVGAWRAAVLGRHDETTPPSQGGTELGRASTLLRGGR